MKTSSIGPLICAGIGLITLSIVIRLSIDKWRKKSVIEAGKSFGFHHLAPGEVLPIVMVPLINRSNRSYLIILRGTINGYSAGFFDLFCGAGKNWFYQSALIVSNPEITMPKFQLQYPQKWSQTLTQKTCGDAITIPGREKDMAPLRLSSDDPQWAKQTFSKAAPQFFQRLRDNKWTIEGLQHSLVIYRWGQQISAKKLKDFAKQTADLATEIYSLCS